MKMQFFFVALFIVQQLFSINALSEQYKILYINSYHSGYSWTDDVTDGVSSHFSERDSFLVHTEFLDGLRHPPDEAEAWFLPYLAQKYQNARFDIIIASDNSALDLVLNNDQYFLFKEVPVIFCGISNPEVYPLEERDLYGVKEVDMFVASFDIMRHLYPDFSKVYFLVDRTVTGSVYRSSAEEVIQRHPDYELVVVDSVYYETVDSLVRSFLEEDAVIFYQGINLDGAGDPLDNMAMARMVSENARIPVFSSYAIDMAGALGGLFSSGFEHGVLCAQLAEKRVKGLPIDQRVHIPPMEGIFDYSKLMKYNINPDLIPLGSQIRNKPETIWSRYRNLIIGNLVVIGLLLLSVILLIRYNASQSKAKALLEKAMEKAYESDRIKGAFLANVSHELRTPLNAICGFSELVKVELEDSQLSEYVEVIHKNSDLLARLVNDLLDISLIDADAMVVNKRNTNLEVLFASLLQQAQSALKIKGKDHISVELKINSDYKNVSTDEFRVCQIMLNYIGNAVKYTETGKIVIGFDHISTLANDLDLAHYGSSYLVLFVKDTGIGIDPENTPLVFERFRSVDSKYVSQHGGFGLGLNISKNLAELLGGEVFVRSEKG
ncbi:sensor histidine kinase, partial [Geofilum rubicundum]|uniref:sensor histidine kinase n=1 Tax=Geofilum rubicundum TaxID=472113 RepID=UPI000785DE46